MHILGFTTDVYFFSQKTSSKKNPLEFATKQKMKKFVSLQEWIWNTFHAARLALAFCCEDSWDQKIFQDVVHVGKMKIFHHKFPEIFTWYSNIILTRNTWELTRFRMKFPHSFTCREWNETPASFHNLFKHSFFQRKKTIFQHMYITKPTHWGHFFQILSEKQQHNTSHQSIMADAEVWKMRGTFWWGVIFSGHLLIILIPIFATDWSNRGP